MADNEQTLYELLKRADCKLDHHEGDLYVESTSVSRAIIETFEKAGGRTNKRGFTDDIDHKPWIDLPFHYVPFEIARTVRQPVAGSGPDAWEMVGNIGDLPVWQLGDVYQLGAESNPPVNAGGVLRQNGYPSIRYLALANDRLEEDFTSLEPVSGMTI